MIRLFRILFLILLTCTIASAQDVNEIINKTLAVMGGKTKYKALKTLSFNARINNNGQNVIMQVYVKYPDKIRIELKNLTNETVVTVFDGKKGWVSNENAAKQVPEGSVALLRAQIDAQIGFFYKNLNNYAKRKIKAEYIGEDNTRNLKVYKVKVTDTDGSEMVQYIDKINFYILRFDFIKDIKGNKQNSYFQIKNFIPYSGYFYPSAAEIYNNGVNSGSITFSNVLINPKLNKNLFILPKK